MVHLLDASRTAGEPRGPGAGSVTGIRRHPVRPHLVVLAPAVAGVVRAAGGWLFDRVAAGWEVVVLVADHTESRPLDILGVRVVDLAAGLAAKRRGLVPHALALDAELWAADARVQEGLSWVLAHDLADEVRWWGPGSSADFGRSACPVLHRASVAAQAFKAQALAAVELPGVNSPVESFYSCVPGSEQRDLVPVP